MASSFPTELASADALLTTLLDLSLTGIILYQPVYAPADVDTISDFAFVQVNPAAQRSLRLLAQPVESFLVLYPEALLTGVFDFYRTAFTSGETRLLDVCYEQDGVMTAYRSVARRVGGLLLVNFTDVADHARGALEAALGEPYPRAGRAGRGRARAQPAPGRIRAGARGDLDSARAGAAR